MSKRLRNLLILNTILSILFVPIAFGLAIMFVMGSISVGQVENPSPILWDLAMFIFFVGMFLPFSIIPALIMSWVFYRLKHRRSTIFFAVFHWLVLLSLILACFLLFSFD